MDTTALDKLAGEIDRPDDDLRAEALDLLRAARPGSLGRLGDAAGWLAAVSGVCPPPAPARARVLVFTADGSVPTVTAQIAAGAGRGVSGYPAGAGTDDAVEALARGLDLADTEADAGTDLLLLAAPSPEARIAAATLIAAVTGADTHAMVDNSGGDAEWMRAVKEVRDGIRRIKQAPTDPLSMLVAAGGTEVAYLTGIVIGAAVRRTPVVVEGVAALAAALVAYRVTDAVAGWILPAHADPHPAAEAALRYLGLTGLLDLGLEPGDGVATVLAASLLAAAAAALASS